MKFHFYGQKGLINLPNGTTVEDLKSLASFNCIIRNYLKIRQLLEKGKQDSNTPKK